MMSMKCLTGTIFALVALIMAGCQKQPAQTLELKYFPADNLDNLVSTTDMDVDREISSDGNGAIRISVPESTTVRLYEIGGIDVDNAKLIYRARLRTEGMDGAAFLEMLCHFPDKGDFFSRDLQNPVTGTTDWTTEEAPFFLKKGEKPDTVRLNLVVAGKGTVWVDDIHLLKAPLR